MFLFSHLLLFNLCDKKNCINMPSLLLASSSRRCLLWCHSIQPCICRSFFSTTAYSSNLSLSEHFGSVYDHLLYTNGYSFVASASWRLVLHSIWNGVNDLKHFINLNIKRYALIINNQNWQLAGYIVNYLY